MSGVGQPRDSHGRPSGAPVFPPCALRELHGTMDTTAAIDAPERARQRSTRTVCLELGRRSLTLGEAEQLGRGSVVRLQERQGAPVQVYADGLLIARGQLLLHGGRLGVRIVELVKSSER